MKLATIIGLLVWPVMAMAQTVDNDVVSVNDLSLIGALTQGSLVHGKVLPQSTIKLNGDKVTVGADGVFVIGFGRDAPLKQQLELTTASGQTSRFTLQLSKRQYKIQRVNGISKTITQPSAANIARSRRDSKQVRAARSIWSPSRFYRQQFIWPVKGPISGVYGSQRFYNGNPSRPHFGLDIAVATGTVVVAPADGVIRLFVPDMFYSGGTLIIDHGMGVSSSFLHLSAGLVKAGDVVKQGQPVARVGSSGRATGPHLDWRMNWLTKRVDPQLLIPAMAE